MFVMSHWISYPFSFCMFVQDVCPNAFLDDMKYVQLVSVPEIGDYVGPGGGPYK